MQLTDKDRAFLERTRAAAMITVRPDGTPHAVRVAIGLVDGKLWSSGVQGRLRTRHLRRDPRCTLFVFESGYGYLTLETTVTILDGPEAPEQNLRLFRAMQAQMSPGPAPGNVIWMGKEQTAEEFVRTMAAEQQLIYQFEITRAYGMT
jgi:PPOX class probable F420-dependent enzyme